MSLCKPSLIRTCANTFRWAQLNSAMTRLKSLTSFPPYGFRYINPVFGMKKDDEGSFSVVCQKELARRKANKYLCEKHNLGLDMISVEYDV